MKIIGSRSEIKAIFYELSDLQLDWISDESLQFIHKKILKQKIRFPLLEFLSEQLYVSIPKKDQIHFLEKIIDLDEIGSYVIAGKILQLQLEQSFRKPLETAERFIIKGNKWYVCDIIGERVFGYALLKYPQKTFSVLQKNAGHKDQWMLRCIGVASHYATKKGLIKEYVEKTFELLLSLSNTTEFHTKKGIGWAAKTTAKFYPDIIQKHGKELGTNPEIKQWFKTKIKIGLGRSNKYASKYNSQKHS